MTYQPLMDVLQQMHSLYGRLIELGESKKEQLVQNRLTELTQTLTHESKVVKALQDAEIARIQALRSFQKSVGLRDDPGMRLQEAVKLCTGYTEKQAMQKTLDEIERQVLKLKELNETNQMLVRHSLDIVNFSLDLLVGSPEEEMVYQKPNAGNSQTKRNAYLDTRA